MTVLLLLLKMKHNKKFDPLFFLFKQKRERSHWIFRLKGTKNVIYFSSFKII